MFLISRLGAELRLPQRRALTLASTRRDPSSMLASLDADVLEDLFERTQVRAGLCRGAHVRLADDFDERHAGAVQVDRGLAGEAVVERLARVLFHVDARDADRDRLADVASRRSGPNRRSQAVDRTARSGIPWAGRGRSSSCARRSRSGGPCSRARARREWQARPRVVEHGKRAGKREAHRAGVRVRRVAEVRRTAAEHLRRRLELHVHLEPDDHLVFSLPLGGTAVGAPCAVTRCPPWRGAPAHVRAPHAARNIVASAKCGAMNWPPTGSPSIAPMGRLIAGTPARFAVAVKMSLRYISYGSERAPNANAVVGVVGVNSRSTLSNALAKSLAMSPRTSWALR